MKFTMILPILFFATSAVISHGQAESNKDHEDDECNQENKQKSLYLKNYYEPSLDSDPATEISTSIVATLVEPLREHNKNGIYEATQIHTRQADGRNGLGGYFGVQWKGTSSKADALLFSIWDDEDEKAVPLLTPNEEARNETNPQCYRNCNDCNDDPLGTGVQCLYNLPQKLEEGDELTLKFEREDEVQSEWFRLDGVNLEMFTGHVWRVSITYESGPNPDFMEQQFPEDVAQSGSSAPFVLGRILFEDEGLSAGGEPSSYGIKNLSNFHEHLGCTICDSFPFESVRKGPTVKRKARPGNTMPRLIEGWAHFGCDWNSLGNCTCRLFDTKSYNFGEMTFMTGGEDMVPHWDVHEDSLMFWTEDNVEHCRDGCTGNN